MNNDEKGTFLDPDQEPPGEPRETGPDGEDENEDHFEHDPDEEEEEDEVVDPRFMDDDDDDDLDDDDSFEELE